MAKQHSTQKENIRKIRFWMASFIPLIIAAVLFVFCFIYEKKLWLYAVCTVVFAVFVLMYIRADKGIKHKDGYTLVQAMHFYLVCMKAGIQDAHPDPEQKKQLCEIAAEQEYAKNLKQNQTVVMYQVGRELVSHFKLERYIKHV